MNIYVNAEFPKVIKSKDTALKTDCGKIKVTRRKCVQSNFLPINVYKYQE